VKNLKQNMKQNSSLEDKKAHNINPKQKVERNEI